MSNNNKTIKTNIPHTDNENQSYDELVRQEYEAMKKQASRTQTNTSDVSEFEYGKIDLTSESNAAIVNEDPEIKMLQKTLEYTNIDVTTLPSKGKFYPPNLTIRIRAARVEEIRDFTMVDENDIVNINDKLNYIIQNCASVYYGSTAGNPKDLLDMDKFKIILLIRELTFPNETLPLPIPRNACKTSGCKQPDHINIRIVDSILETKENPILQKYYSEEKRCYAFKTKDYGVIEMRPPSIGVNSTMLNWRVRKEKNNEQYDIALVTLISYFANDWRGLNDDVIFKLETAFAGWTTGKFTTVFRLAEMIDNSSIAELVTTCEKCGGEMRVPLNFRFSTRELFVPSISDSTDSQLI